MFILLLILILWNFVWWRDFPLKEISSKQRAPPSSSCEMCLKTNEWVCLLVGLISSSAWIIFSASLLWNAMTASHTIALHGGKLLLSIFLVYVEDASLYKATYGRPETNLGFVCLLRCYRKTHMHWFFEYIILMYSLWPHAWILHVSTSDSMLNSCAFVYSHLVVLK